ncbi:MAG: cell division protein FtsA [Chloroflexi bacterium]|nr:cell division protein FtsA [Chloroflexota bacterium]
MPKRKVIAGIDVGTTKVCTIVARPDPSEEGLQVLGVGVVPSRGLHKGMVVNVNEAREAIKESIARAQQSSGTKIDSAYVGVTGRHITSTNSKGVISIPRNDRLVRQDDLKRVLDAARNVVVPSDRKILHAIPRQYALDGQVGVKNPVGMHGFRLDVETHIITAAVSSIQNLVKCIRSVGLEIDDLVLEAMASGEAVLSQDEKEMGVILADVGGGTTDISVFKEGSIYHTSVLPVAGYQVTSDIALGLGLPFDIAEGMKRKYGNVAPHNDGKDQNGADIHIDNGHSISYIELCNIMRARLEETLRLILLEMPTSEYLQLAPAGLVLTGGSSIVPGLQELAQETLRIPVRIGLPSGVYGITDVLNHPSYSTGVGLLLWGSKGEGQANANWSKTSGSWAEKTSAPWKKIFSLLKGVVRR